MQFSVLSQKNQWKTLYKSQSCGWNKTMDIPSKVTWTVSHASSYLKVIGISLSCFYWNKWQGNETNRSMWSRGHEGSNNHVTTSPLIYTDTLCIRKCSLLLARWVTYLILWHWVSSSQLTWAVVMYKLAWETALATKGVSNPYRCRFIMHATTVLQRSSFCFKALVL